ncbi:MAG: Gfo/Idh/MocA family oxidoreductase [Planctomycetia bacterium]|nr:Gfo/Idh/MocA family oxidoreductase [Planctomycetia bacterium]
MPTRSNRREFLQNTTTGMLAAAALATAGRATFAQEPAKKPVRIGVVGTGPRGRWHIQNMLTNQQPLEVTAICDIKPAALQAGVDVVKKLSGKEPATYSKDEHDYLNLCQRDDVDAVLAAVPPKWLGRMSIDAKKAGKHAAHEVSGCYTIEECWEIVETKEKTGKRCMMLENCCYGEENMQIMHMIRQDVFGEPYFGEGSYIHDGRHYMFDSSGKITWRGELIRDAYGSSYCPHGLGSPSKWLGINDGDRFESCVCMMSRPKEAHAYCVAKFGADSEPAKWTLSWSRRTLRRQMGLLGRAQGEIPESLLEGRRRAGEGGRRARRHRLLRHPGLRQNGPRRQGALDRRLRRRLLGVDPPLLEALARSRRRARQGRRLYPRQVEGPQLAQGPVGLAARRRATMTAQSGVM